MAYTTIGLKLGDGLARLTLNRRTDRTALRP